MVAIAEKRRARLAKLANSFAVEYRKVASSILDRQIVVSPAFDNTVQLLTLYSWTIRYSVTLRWLLERLFSYYGKTIARSRSKTTVGIALRTLCGRKSRQVIEEAILREFPDGENEQLWKDEMRAKLNPPPLPKRRSDDVLKFVKGYTAWVAKKKEEDRALTDRMKRRPWRGNPWK